MQGTGQKGGVPGCLRESRSKPEKIDPKEEGKKARRLSDCRERREKGVNGLFY